MDEPQIPSAKPSNTETKTSKTPDLTVGEARLLMSLGGIKIKAGHDLLLQKDPKWKPLFDGIIPVRDSNRKPERYQSEDLYDELRKPDSNEISLRHIVSTLLKGVSRDVREDLGQEVLFRMKKKISM